MLRHLTKTFNCQYLPVFFHSPRMYNIFGDEKCRKTTEDTKMQEIPLGRY